MSLEVFNAYVAGYSDRLLDQQILAMQTGHWAAYFVGSKHPKTPKNLAETMHKQHMSRDAKRSTTHVERPEVDVETYLEREERFRAYYSNKVGD